MRRGVRCRRTTTGPWVRRRRRGALGVQVVMGWVGCPHLDHIAPSSLPLQDGEVVDFMTACNPRGPLVVHITKLFPKQDCTRFDAFGRIISGTIRPGDRVRRGWGGKGDQTTPWGGSSAARYGRVTG